jgi:hypothetical protein
MYIQIDEGVCSPLLLIPGSSQGVPPDAAPLHPQVDHLPAPSGKGKSATCADSYSPVCFQCCPVAVATAKKALNN